MSTTNKDLVAMLRREEERSRALAEALRDVIHTLENVQGCGGWGSVATAVAKAKTLLRAV